METQIQNKPNHTSAKDNKFKVEVLFSKNRHYPRFGPDAYNIESHSVYIPYGKKHHFKTSQKALEFVKSKIDANVLGNFDSVCITNWRGYGGSCEYLKQHRGKSDTNPINKVLADDVLSY